MDGEKECPLTLLDVLEVPLRPLHGEAEQKFQALERQFFLGETDDHMVVVVRYRGLTLIQVHDTEGHCWQWNVNTHPKQVF